MSMLEDLPIESGKCYRWFKSKIKRSLLTLLTITLVCKPDLIERYMVGLYLLNDICLVPIVQMSNLSKQLENDGQINTRTT